MEEPNSNSKIEDSFPEQWLSPPHQRMVEHSLSLEDETAGVVQVPASADDADVVGIVPESSSSSSATTEQQLDQQRQQQQRQGTISSARFNILSTMVGGGSLSLPLAFSKTGNALVGPILLIATAALTEFCFTVLLDAARTLSLPLPPAPPLFPVIVVVAEETTITPGTTTLTPSAAAAANNHHHHSRRAVAAAAANVPPGKDSLEKICAAAFGSNAYCASTALVTAMCFFGIVGYCVLLRDMLEPINDWLLHQLRRLLPSLFMMQLVDNKNLTMLVVVLGVTPLCTLPTLTALQRFGAASMCAVLVLGLCILYRSLQCTAGFMEHHHHYHHHEESHWTDGFRLFPDSATPYKDVLDVLPLFISCYVCHYNVPVVHNDLRDPTAVRVQHWLRTTVWGSTAFYLTVGVAGSAYATACSTSSSDTTAIHGNILLDFPPNDPLLRISRMCLAVTIALAFPMLTIPARDILMRSAAEYSSKRRKRRSARIAAAAAAAAAANHHVASFSLTEPLLQNGDVEVDDNDNGIAAEQPVSAGDEEQPLPVHAAAAASNNNNCAVAVVDVVVETATTTAASAAPPSLGTRLLASVAVFWTGAAVASCVSSIDVVWCLLGSSLSILLSYLVPCGCYLVLVARQTVVPAAEGHPRGAGRGGGSSSSFRDKKTMLVCWLLILVFTPLMFVSTANAVYNTFIRK